MIALIGGAEFRPACEAMDRALIDLAGGARARVGIIPTAAARENPRLAAQNGVRHFRRLGANAASVMVVNRADAENPGFAAQIEWLDLAYLTGGDPVHLLETLRGTPAWEALLNVASRSGVLAGSSAGAMILGGQMWQAGLGWRDGLALAPLVAIIPHHETLASRWDVEKKMKPALPPGIKLIGLDECAGLAGSADCWTAMGAGTVTVYAAEGTRVYRAGESVALD